MVAERSDAKLDFAGLNARLLSSPESTVRRLFEWFPQGKVQGNEFKIGALDGRPGESLSINITDGVWKDFESGEGGSDPISLFAAKHRIGQGEAYKMLNGEARLIPSGAARHVALSPEQAQLPMEPPPEDAPRGDENFIHPKHGEPSAVYRYLTRTSDLWYVVARYQTGKGKKTFCPFIWKAGAWRPEAAPKPRPLYGLERLDPLPKSTCIVVEGEKAADALRGIIAQPILTWPGGAQSVRSADWEPLRGRNVIVWGDADSAGDAARTAVCNILHGMGCKVNWVDTSGMSAGWDAADAVEAGMDADDIAQLVQDRRKPMAPLPETPALPASEPVPAPQPTSVYKLWADAGLQVTSKGQPYPHESNVLRILEFMATQGSIDVWYDTFQCRMVSSKDGVNYAWTDADYAVLLVRLQSDWSVAGLKMHTLRNALTTYRKTHSRHCVREWLATLPEWDGVERLQQLCASGLGASQNEYAKAVGRCFIVSMVARVMQPGCKVDSVVVLEGGEGMFKSTALRTIGGEWFAEIHDSITSKDFPLGLQGKWLVEVSELQSFKRAENNQIKGRITDSSDHFRVPYGTTTEDFPRQCVLSATTNDDEWLTDETGGRRFWPVKCGRIDLDWIKTNRPQLFAEAMARYHRGEPWHDVPLSTTQDEQAERREYDPWMDAVRSAVNSRSAVTVSDTLESIGVKVDRQTRADARRMASCLRQLGWRKVTVREGHATRKMWKPSERLAELRQPDLDEDF